MWAAFRGDVRHLLSCLEVWAAFSGDVLQVLSCLEMVDILRGLGLIGRWGHGERSRLQLHFKLGCTENLSILVVNALAVHSVSQGVSHIF